MPKSKRNKQVELSKARKHGMEGKKKLYEEIRSCVESYANIFIFSVNDMRNSKIKSVRDQWKHSRFFIGKNKVMALALGRTPEEEYRTNLHKIGEHLKGERGLLFSNQSVDEVLKWFTSYSEGDFARSGNLATETVVLDEGPLSQFPHNLEPYLRQLGLPTTLKKGVIHLIQEHTICKEGDVLTPETAKILKLLGYEMAEFYIKIECVWSQDGSFKDLKSDTESKENINHSDSMNTSKSIPKSTESVNEEKMEVTEDDVENNQENKDQDLEYEEIPTLVEIDKTNDFGLDSMSIMHKKVEGFTVEEDDSDKKENNDVNFVEENNDKNNVDTVSVDDSTNKTNLDSTEEKMNENIESSIEDKVLNEDTKESSDIINSTNSLAAPKVNKSAIQSPHLSEKRPKYSPKVTRSVAKKVAKKTIDESSSTKTPAKKIAQKIKLTNKTPSIEKDAADEKEAIETKDEVPDKKPSIIRGKAHKRHSTGESPMERQLRNRSVKIVKNKK